MRDFDDADRQQAQARRPPGKSRDDGRASSPDRPLDPRTALSLQRAAGNRAVSQLVVQTFCGSPEHDDNDEGALLQQKAGRGELLGAEVGVAALKGKREAQGAKKLYDASKLEAERTPAGKVLKGVGLAASAVGHAFPPAKPASTGISLIQKGRQAWEAWKLKKSGHMDRLIDSSEDDYEARLKRDVARGKGRRSEEHEEEGED
jgi:hypothetical protein